MSSSWSTRTSLARKLKAPEELSKECASRIDDFGFRCIELNETKNPFSGVSWQPSSGIWGNVESSLAYTLPHLDGTAADAPAVKPKKGTDSGYSSRHHSDNLPVPGDSKFWEQSEIVKRPSTGAWLASDAARAKVLLPTSWRSPQAATPPPTLSWSADIPFKCYMCSASFKYSSDLSRHQESHSPAKDSKRASGVSGSESAQEIPPHGDGQNVPIVREQVTPPIVSHSSSTISEPESKAIQEELRNNVGNASLGILSKEGWAGQEDSHQFAGEHLQLTSQTIKEGASALPDAESSLPLSVEVDISSSSLSDEETDWGDDDSDDSFAEYSGSYFRFDGDSTGGTNNQDIFVKLALSPAKQAVVDRLMKEFWAIFNAETRVAT